HADAGVRRAGLRANRLARHARAEGGAGTADAGAGAREGARGGADPVGDRRGAGQRVAHRRRQGGRRARLVRRPSVGHRERQQGVRRELPRTGASPPHPGGCGHDPPQGLRVGGALTRRMDRPLAPYWPHADVPGIEQLVELALDLRSTWEHSGDELWGQLDHELWALTHNPWGVLQTVAPPRLEEALRDRAFRVRLEALVGDRRAGLAAPAWFQRTHAQAPLTCVAYFSMEFGLSEALPIYSGGLGNVAGDQLKAAHDLGVPVIGIGLLYQQGYFRQVIEPDGSQRALYPPNQPSFLPITPAREEGGEWLWV